MQYIWFRSLLFCSRLTFDNASCYAWFRYTGTAAHGNMYSLADWMSTKTNDVLSVVFILTHACRWIANNNQMSLVQRRLAYVLALND